MNKEIIRNYGKSIRSKLLNIAKKEDVFYQTILTRYFQERLLYRLSQTRYRMKLDNSQFPVQKKQKSCQKGCDVTTFFCCFFVVVSKPHGQGILLCDRHCFI